MFAILIAVRGEAMGFHIFVGRQPILDRNGQVFGYELLYRNSEKNVFPDVDPEKATIQLLVNTFLSIGIDRVVGKSLSFINFTGELLTKDLFTSLHPECVVIEILEDVEITPSLITRIRQLKREGFRLALDDFVMQEQYAIHTELFHLIDFVKVDYMAVEKNERKNIEKFIKSYPHIRMLAEKIETKEQFEEAKKSGYDLFQGYFFSKPEIIKGVEIPSNFNLHLRIIEKLNEETPNINEIARMILQDISLTYKLLRFINSMHFSIPKKVRSIKQAIVIIGLRGMRKWMRILTLQDIGETSGEGRIKALVSFSLSRGRMCELLAIHKGKDNTDEYFFAGMFSLMDAIMGRSYEEILSLIPLSETVAMTLQGGKTEMTPYLDLAIAMERFDWENVRKHAKTIGIEDRKLSEISRQANLWAQTLD